MKNNFIRGRLQAPDSDAVKKFYEKVFTWSLVKENINGRDYLMIEPSEGPGGEPHGEVEKNRANQWLPFVEVEDVTKTLDAVKANGGTVVEKRTVFGTHGICAVFSDPKGALLGIWQQVD